MSIFSQLAQADLYYNDQAYTSASYDGVMFAAALALFVIFASLFVISYVIHAFLLSRIFKKAGVKQWIAWVPFYNIWKTLELGNQQGFWAVLSIVPVVSIVAWIFIYIALYNIGLKLQKEGWFVTLAIFVPVVWFVWLAFDSSKWDDSKVPDTKGHIVA